MFPLQELNQLSLDALKSELKKAYREQFKYKMGVGTNRRKDNHMLKAYRIYISNILTIFQEKNNQPKNK